MAKAKLNLLAVRVQIGQDGVAFCVGQALDVRGVGRADKQRFAARHWVGDDDRVAVAAVHLDDFEVALVRHGVLAQGGRNRAVQVVPRLQAIEVLFHALRQRVIGRRHADPAGIATAGRQNFGLRHGDDGRAGQKALVVVPHIGTVTQLGVDDGDLLQTLAQVGEKGVHFWLAKMLGNRQMLRRRQIGNVQHEGFVLDQCRFDGGQRLGRKPLAKIKINGFGANGKAKGADSERRWHREVS